MNEYLIRCIEQCMSVCDNEGQLDCDSDQCLREHIEYLRTHDVSMPPLVKAMLARVSSEGEKS